MKEEGTMPTAPSTGNYYLGKGILKFDKLDVDGLPTGLRDMGNAPNFTIQPVVETLDHFSSRAGIKEKDLQVVTLVGATVKFTLDEYDPENLAIGMLGDVSGNTVRGLTMPQIEGELQFLGANDVGPNYHASIWRVRLKPTSELGFITEDWGKIDFEGEVLADVAGHASSPFFDIVEYIAS
jgi:hypothetical protein